MIATPETAVAALSPAQPAPLVNADWGMDNVRLTVELPGGTRFETAIDEASALRVHAQIEWAIQQVRRFKSGFYNLPLDERIVLADAEREAADATTALPRDWRAVEVLPGTLYPDELDECVPTGWYVYGGQPDEETPYVLRVEQSPESDGEAAARAVAARLNGGAL